jgi:NitT/TauT family transport system substrate-binding protein
MLVCRSTIKRVALATAVVGLGGLVAAAAPTLAAEKVRVGVLSSGTAQWEMDTIVNHKLAEEQGLDLEIVGLGSKLTHAIALETHEADIVMTDYVWVSGRRAEGADYTFVPHANVAGGIIAGPNSGVTSIADLAGKVIGVVGGPQEDNWLFARAYAKKVTGTDLADLVKEAKFGAPPLLNELAEQGDLDAVMNFWHFNARLRAKGFVDVVLKELGVVGEPPILGWVFSEQWAAEHGDVATGFLRASLNAKKLLLESDEEWNRLRPIMGNELDDATFMALRDAYREGIATTYGAEEIAAATKVVEILAETGGEEVAGGTATLSPGTFWTGFNF